MAVITADTKVITDAPSSLDLAMTVRHTAGANRILIPKELARMTFSRSVRDRRARSCSVRTPCGGWPLRPDAAVQTLWFTLLPLSSLTTPPGIHTNRAFTISAKALPDCQKRQVPRHNHSPSADDQSKIGEPHRGGKRGDAPARRFSCFSVGKASFREGTAGSVATSDRAHISK